MRKKAARASAFDLGQFLRSAGRSRRIITYECSQAISAQGEPCTSVLYVQSGAVKLSLLSRTGKEAVLAVLGPGVEISSARVPCRTTVAHRDGDGARAEQDPRRSEASHDPPAAFAARILRSLHHAHAGPQHPHRGGPGGLGFIGYNSGGVTVHPSLVSVVLHE